MAPFLLDHPQVDTMFPPDAIERAKVYLANIKGGLGAYSDSRGNPYIRQEIANFIEQEHGVKSHPDTIFCSNGASECVRNLLTTIIRGPGDGVMVPIPQYPLYSAAIALYNGQLVPYYLEEDSTWGLNVDELNKSIREAREKGICVRALVFINPGNPTGQCLTQENISSLIEFCYHNRLILMADEVYQVGMTLTLSFSIITPRADMRHMTQITLRKTSTILAVHSSQREPRSTECRSRFGLDLHLPASTLCPKEPMGSADCAAVTLRCTISTRRW